MENQITEVANNILNEMKAMPQDELAFELNRMPKLDIGIFDSIPTDAYIEKNVQTEYGLRNRLIINHKIQIQDKTYEVKHKMNISRSKDSRYVKAGKEIYEKLGRNFSWSEVINRPAKVEIGHYTTTEGDVYEYIKEASYDVLSPIILMQNNSNQRNPKFQSQTVTEVTEIVPMEQNDKEVLNDFE